MQLLNRGIPFTGVSTTYCGYASKGGTPIPENVLPNMHAIWIDVSARPKMGMSVSSLASWRAGSRKQPTATPS